MTVTVYTLPNCVQCHATKHLLEQLGVDYVVVDLTDQPKMVKIFADQNLTAAPIVTYKDQIWSGFRYEKLKALKRAN
jgi:glutaredoxin-like protein NrdH